MNYKRAALEQLSKLSSTDKEFRTALVYSILSLGQNDLVEAICRAAVEFITTDDAGEKQMAYLNLYTAVMDLVGE